MDAVTTVLLCDDHPVFRGGLGALFAEVPQIEVVGEAETGEEAVRLARELRPDVVIMDLGLPGMSGVEATRLLLDERPATAVLVLTMFEDDVTIAAALRAGARGYLLKGAPHDQITRAITAVAHGDAILSNGVADRLVRLVGGGATHPFPELSEREAEVLELVAAGHSNDAIATRLFLSPKTIRNYVSSILSKLHVESRAEAVAKARDAGIGGRGETST